jgi:hypothetical protein
MAKQHPFTQLVLKLTFNPDDWKLFVDDCRHALKQADPKLLPKKLKDQIWRAWISYTHVTPQWERMLANFKQDKLIWPAICKKRGQSPRMRPELRNAIRTLDPDQWWALASRDPRLLNEAIQAEYRGTARYPKPRTRRSRKTGADVASSMPIIIEDWPKIQ